MNLYLFLKTIHILSATALFGIGAGSAYYMLRSHLNGNIQSIVITTKHVIAADWIFTTTSIIVQPITGIWMVMLIGWPLTQLWIMWSLILYILAGLCWLPVVWLQYQIHNLAKQAMEHNESLPSLYYRYMKIWFWLGWPAFISLLTVFCLMIFKPI